MAKFVGEGSVRYTIIREIKTMISSGETKEQVEVFLIQKQTLPSFEFTGTIDTKDPFGVHAKIRELDKSRNAEAVATPEPIAGSTPAAKNYILKLN